ncbi:MAG: 1-deoxy-D-xylulose-5-phosphate reductoisomerase [Longimicrobiales bacterium]|nr:1-deoxy-D-xylulose-5-phosphate reductoisomerase [Longimicrobiales bacterium]
MIRIALLGSTGSIGRSALQVVSRHPDRLKVVALTANRRSAELEAQVSIFEPDTAVLSDPTVALPQSTSQTRWRSGREALIEVAARDDVDVVLNACVGAAGLGPTLAALRSGHRVALANKESLVVGGPLVLNAAHAGGGEIIPIDSEHSAILQCLEGSQIEDVQRIILTASGGPFRGRTAQDLCDVSAAQALKHPTWDMGAKITIDSATLANKALEVIEAHYLYGLEYDQIGAVIHPQSIIHSFVELVDGSVLAQLGFPTMEIPILYALVYPERVADSALRSYDPVQSPPLTFEDIDHLAFPMFALGVDAGRRSGCTPLVYNAANEVAVQAFLEDRISFPEIADVVAEAMDRTGTSDLRDMDDVIAVDTAAREVAVDVTVRLGEARMGTNS